MMSITLSRWRLRARRQGRYHGRRVIDKASATLYKGTASGIFFIMSYRIKTQPKSGGSTDEAQFLSGVERLGLLAQEYRAQLALVCAVLLLGAVIVGVVMWLNHRSAEHAQALEQQATRLYLDRPIDKPEEADQNLKNAIELYRRLLEQYPRSPSAPLALFHLGNALFQLNDLPGAIEAYQKYVAAYPDNRPLLGLVLQRLGYARLLQGNLDEAAKAFTMAIDMPGTLNKDQALYELGKLEESRAQPEGALARYQELSKNYPNSPFAGEAAVRTKALETKAAVDAPAFGSSPAAPPAQQTGK